MHVLGRAVALLALVLASPAPGQEPERRALPVGSSASGKASDDVPAVYSFAATQAGLLAVTLVGKDPEADLVIETFDEDMQPLDDGSADRDRYGHKGKEYLAVMLPEPGTFLVRIKARSREAAGFSVSAAFAPAPGFSQPDPDRRPSKARAVTVGKPVQDTLGGQDRWDWFAIRSEAEGTLTILTKAAEGDLKLEAFAEGNYTDDIARSDADLQDKKGNESVSFEVAAGQTIYARVTIISGDAQIDYKLITALIPN
jgi:hypothetical protein